MERGQRLGGIAVTGELMQEMFFTSTLHYWFRVQEGLPPGAEFAYCYHDAARNRFVFVYRHESFTLVEPGGPVPLLPPPTLEAVHGVRYDHNAGQLVVRELYPGGVRVAKTQEEFDADGPKPEIRAADVLRMFARTPAAHTFGADEPHIAQEASR